MCSQIFSNDFSNQDQLKQHAVQGQGVCASGKLSQRQIVPVVQETLLVGSIFIFPYSFDLFSIRHKMSSLDHKKWVARKLLLSVREPSIRKCLLRRKSFKESFVVNVVFFSEPPRRLFWGNDVQENISFKQPSDLCPRPRTAGNNISGAHNSRRHNSP